MMTLALDTGTHCGWAHSGGASGTWDLSIRRDESAGMRLVRFEGKLNEVRRDVGVDLVVYEAARHAGPKMQGALVIQAMIQGVLVAWCERNGIEYRGYSPSEIKKHATGKGNAGKGLMLEAAVQRWPHVRDDNEADAIWIREFAKNPQQWTASAKPIKRPALKKDRKPRRLF